MPFTKLAIKKAVKDIRKRATGFVLLAILFFTIGILQDIFTKHQIHKTTLSELNGWADEIAAEVYNGKWDLKAYRQAFISAPVWYVFTDDGLLIDNEFPKAGLLALFRSVKLPADSIFETPKTFTSELGEKWRLLGGKIHGGVVIVGLEDPNDLEMADRELATSLSEFGSTLEKAVALSPRQIDQDIEYAVVSDSGELKSGWGGVPLKIDPTLMLTAARTEKPVKIGSQSYLLIAKPILDSNGKTLGTIVVPKDITTEQQILNEQWKFNLALSASAFGVAILIALYFIGREIVMPAKHIPLDEALLRKEENENIEFKPALDGDFGNRDLRLEALKTIAAFMNTDGGTLFIGVLNDGKICGIEKSLERFNGSRDGYRRHLGNLVAEKIGVDYAIYVRDSFEEKDGKFVCIVEVEKSLKPAFVKWENDNFFFVRQCSRTVALDAKETARWLGLRV